LGSIKTDLENELDCKVDIIRILKRMNAFLKDKRDLAKEILSQIFKALVTVIYRFAPVKSLADLSDSP
jgi:hypothetical protein